MLDRARTDELALLAHLRRHDRPAGLVPAAEHVWTWLSADEHRPLLRLWAEAYARSLVEPNGPWAGFARTTVEDWLDVLADCQPQADRESEDGAVRRTLTLAVLRGALLDLLATEDERRVTAAVHWQLALLQREDSGT
ncbi:TetR family transcriptional regulator [Streptomyces olivaceoviridis]